MDSERRSMYPSYSFTQGDLKFLCRKRHCSIALSSIARTLEASEKEQHLQMELLIVAQKILENPDFIQTCHNLLPQLLRFLSRKFPLSGENTSHFLLAPTSSKTQSNFVDIISVLTGINFTQVCNTIFKNFGTCLIYKD